MYYHLWGCVQSTRVHLWEHKLLSSEQNVWTDIPLQTCVMPPETVIIPHSTPVKKNYSLCWNLYWGDPEYWHLCDSTWLDFGNTKWAVNNCLKEVFALATGALFRPSWTYVSLTLSGRFQPWNCNGPPTGHTRQSTHIISITHNWKNQPQTS